MNNRDATKSLKGYIYQLHEFILYLLESDIKEIKLEGLEDIDYLTTNNNKILIQLKYHNSKNNNNSDENFGKESGFYKVYKSFILNYTKYENIKLIIYRCVCEDELNGTKELKYKKEEFQKFIKNKKLEQFKKYLEEDNKINIENIEINRISEEFIKLISSEVIENYKFDIKEFYNKILNNKKFNIQNQEAVYIKEYIFQKIYTYVMENLFENNNNKIIISNLIKYINEELNKNINIENIFQDFKILLLKNNNIDESIINNIMINNKQIIEEISNNNLFNLLIIFNKKEEYKLYYNEYIKLFINKIINKIDNKDKKFDEILKKILIHINYIKENKCCYKHFENLLKNNNINKNID